MRSLAILLVLGTLALTGCHSMALTATDEPAPTPEATGQNDGMFDAIAELAGEWKMTDPAGEEHFFEFEVTSGGSAVREIMFPGHPHEMTNFYHMDGDDLVVTHYCAAGNQPRMIASEAKKSDEGTVYLFDFDSVSNLRKDHDHYMGNLTVTVLENGKLRQDWRSYDREGNLTDPVTFELTRSKDAKTMKASFGK